MTRSVEIPEAAVESALDVAMDDGHNGIQCTPDRNFAVTMRAALEAARPHIEAAMCICPTDADVTSDMRTETGQHLATCPLALYRAALPYLAPAGDGGLREAEFGGYLDGLRDAKQAGEDCTDGFGNLYRLDWLDAMEKLREDAFKAMDTAPAVPQPAVALGDVLQVLDDVYTSGAMGGEWPTLGADAVMELLRSSAVPQPVDREALAICLHSFDGFAIETGEQWSECNADRKGAFLYQADAVVALLGGSGETPGMELSRLGIEANARNNGAAVLAGEQEQVER